MPEVASFVLDQDKFMQSLEHGLLKYKSADRLIRKVLSNLILAIYCNALNLDLDEFLKCMGVLREKLLLQFDVQSLESEIEIINKNESDFPVSTIYQEILQHFHLPNEISMSSDQIAF